MKNQPNIFITAINNIPNPFFRFNCHLPDAVYQITTSLFKFMFSCSSQSENNETFFYDLIKTMSKYKEG